MTNKQKPKGKWTPAVIQHMLDRVPSLPWGLGENGNIEPCMESWLPMVGKVDSVEAAELIVCMPDMITQLLQEREQLRGALLEVSTQLDEAHELLTDSCFDSADRRILNGLRLIGQALAGDQA